MGGLTSGSWQYYTYEEIERAESSLAYLKWIAKERDEPNYSFEEVICQLEHITLNKISAIIK